MNYSKSHRVLVWQGIVNKYKDVTSDAIDSLEDEPKIAVGLVDMLEILTHLQYLIELESKISQEADNESN